ncbi:hypothetical protein BGZ94_006930 [Podila epigama]|nr:hypothetical protein BGZ94_006930 [Podila epigama]
MDTDLLCSVTDKDYLYSVSLPSWEDENYVVVTRVHLSRALDTGAAWEIISVMTTNELGNIELERHTPGTSCSIGMNGMLYVHTTRDFELESFYLDINNVRGNKEEGASGYDRKCKQDVGMRTRWQWVHLLWPRFAYQKERLMITNGNTESPDAAVVYSHLNEQVSRLTTPQIYVFPIEREFVGGGSLNYRPPPPPPVTLANTTGAIYDMSYGDKMLFTIIRELNETSLDAAGTHTKKTLVYLRLEAPYNTTDIKKSVVSIPWENECSTDTFSVSGASAAANGKFYHLCSTGLQSNAAHLYIHDTKKNSTKSYRYPFEVAPSDKKMTLVFNAGSTDGDDPAYILRRDGMYLNLPTSDTEPGSLLERTSGARLSAKWDFAELCDFAKKGGFLDYARIITGVLVSLAVVGIFTIWLMKRRKRMAMARKRTEQERLPGYEESSARDAATSSQGGDAVELNVMGNAPSTEPPTNDELPLYTRRI